MEYFHKLLIEIYDSTKFGYPLKFISHKDSRIISTTVGFFEKRPDGLYDFKWDEYSGIRDNFGKIIEGDSRIDNFIEFWEAERGKRTPVYKRNKTVVELRREWEKRCPPKNYEVIFLKPTGQNKYMAMYIDTTPDFDNSEVRSGLCLAVSGGIIKDELEIKVGVAQQSKSGSIHLQLDVERLKELIKKGGTLL